MTNYNTLSIIIPANNEAVGLARLLPNLKARWGNHEIIVVDDGSSDDTSAVCRENDVKVVLHPYCMGNGAALKSGARASSGETLIFLDADAQHTAEEVEKLLALYQEKSLDMVVGERSRKGQANLLRWFGNSVYNRLASWIVGHHVKDLTSGCRVINAAKYKEFLHLLPNGFSAPSTITLAFFRSGYSVQYLPIAVQPRIGKSHMRLFRDGFRFLIILYKLTILYSPLKIFLPLSFLHFLAGASYYGYTFYTHGTFTNMSAVFITAAIIILLIGLVSEQITFLMYQSRSK